MTHYDMVKEFHEAFGHPSPDSPTLSDDRFQDFRLMLIREELNELEYAFKNNDLVEAADALADIVYVVLGTAVGMGIPFDEVFNEVHSSNMSKLGDDGKPIYNELGKIMKPDGWKMPNIEEIIFKAMK